MIYSWQDAAIIAVIGFAEVAFITSLTYPLWR